MPPLQRILAATDLSAPARRAAERAALLCKETSAALDLLHVANLAPLERLRQFMATTPEALSQRVLDAAQHKLQELADMLHQRYGVTPGMHLATGLLTTEVAQQARQLQADLLVCGARGESVVRHLLLGTTALRMLSTTPCPVLVVKQAPHEPYRRVLVPVDFSAHSLRAIAHARSVAPGAELVLLHAFEVPFEGHLRYASVDEDTISHYRVVARQEATEKLQALCQAAALAPKDCHTLVQHGDAAVRIIEQEQEQDCDLIVMGKHGESALENLLLGSVTKHVLAESQSDILVSV